MGPLIGNCSNLVIFKKNIVIFKANLVIFKTNIVIFWTKKDYDKFSHIRELKDQISNWGYLYPIGDNITNRGYQIANWGLQIFVNWGKIVIDIFPCAGCRRIPFPMQLHQ